jgi:hypothetical protein
VSSKRYMVMVNFVWMIANVSHVCPSIRLSGEPLSSCAYSPKYVEKLFGNSQARARRLTINRIMDA